MVAFDPQLLAVWGVVVVTLGLQIYLVSTWPTSDSQRSKHGPDAESKPVGSARSLDDLEDVLASMSWDYVAPAKPGALASPNGQSLPRAVAHDSEFRSLTRKKNARVTMRDRIIRAGIYHKRGIATFQLFRLAFCLSLLLAGGMTALLVGLNWDLALVIGSLTGLAGYLVPSFWLDRRLRLRQTRIRRALPDALDLITVCMQGGLSLPASLARVSQELGTAHPMLTKELAIVEREVQMGRATGDAIRQFAHRFDLEELRSLSSVIGQAERFGGSITSSLRTYADGLRVKRRQRAEEMAQKAAVKLLFPTLLCIFPGIFVVILGPTVIRMYQVMVLDNPLGG